MNELSEFLNDHYVEAQGGHFRLAYSKEFLQWAYQFPGHKKDYTICVRNSKNKKLLGTIMCIVCKIQAFDQELIVCETNFTAVHHKLRDKKLGQIMITEILRRTRKDGLPLGFYQSVRCQPSPFLITKGASRIIDVEKLLDIQYDCIPPGMNRKQYVKGLELPKKNKFKISGNLRRMEEKDLA